MIVTRLPLSELNPPEKNVRIHSATQIEEFKRSVNMFGQIRPIVVDEHYTILAGNGLYETLKALGWTEADCYVVEGLSEVQKKKLMLVDNRIYALGVDDLQAFDDIILELDNDFDVPGYDPELLQTLTIDLSGADDIMSGYGIISDESREEMHRAAERYEREDKSFEQEYEKYTPKPANQPQEAPSFVSQTESDIGVSAEETPLETQRKPLERRFLVCPKCGEKIWL